VPSLTDHPLWSELRELRVPLVPELALLLLPPDAASWTRLDPEARGWPYWAFAWPGGQALARHLLDHPSLVAGRRVLAFGAGGGIEAIAAARAGARVTCTELDPLACEMALLNAARNGVQLEAECVDVLGTDLEQDVLLIADVCYEVALATRVLTWAEAQHSRGVTVLIADPGRLELLAQLGYPEVGHAEAPFDGAPSGSVTWRTIVYAVNERDGGSAAARLVTRRAVPNAVVHSR
jgi:predicted nicotinamide N-methyase